METCIFEGVTVTPSQKKILETLRKELLQKYGEGYEYKRFEIYPFTSNQSLEVLIEIGLIDETPLDAIINRTVRQIFVGERGGCELANPADQSKRGKIKGLKECVSADVS